MPGRRADYPAALTCIALLKTELGLMEAGVRADGSGEATLADVYGRLLDSIDAAVRTHELYETRRAELEVPRFKLIDGQIERMEGEP